MIKSLSLTRSYLDNGTFGKIYHPEIPALYTVERPWLSNLPWDKASDIASCIPPGEYAFKPISTTRHPNSFFLENVNLGVSWNGNTTRTAIEMHIANFVNQLRGCIAPGLSLHPEVWGVARSGDAMKILNNLIGTDTDWIIRIN